MDYIGILVYSIIVTLGSLNRLHFPRVHTGVSGSYERLEVHRWNQIDEI